MNNKEIELAKELIKFPSITPIDAGIIDFLVSYLTPIGFKCEKLVFGEVTNLYARFGEDDPNFCFAGHTDVVPAGDNWTYDPFTPTIVDGMLYGRGASDMKAALAASIIATSEFIQNNNFKGSISFLITGDEEGPAKNGTAKVLEHLKEKGETLSACIVGEPTCAENFGDIIKYGRRGSISFSLTINGTQGHVAYPSLAENPINSLIKILAELKSHNLDDGNEDFDPSNLEITDITVGNKADNVIPAQAKAKINIRFNNLHTSESLTKFVENICEKYSKNFILEAKHGAESFINSKNSDVLKHLSKAVAVVTGNSPSLSTTGGTSDARFIKDFCQVAEFGLLNKTAHHKDEHVAIADITTLKEIYLKFLKLYFPSNKV
jgi:succinyl-diaminopimelate desuccinylase